MIDLQTSWLTAYTNVAGELADSVGGGAYLAADLLRRLGYDAATNQFADDSPLLWATPDDLAQRLAAEPELSGVSNVVQRAMHHFEAAAGAAMTALADLPRLFRAVRSQGYRIGIASMDHAAGIAATLERFEIADLVDFTAGSDSGYGVKPTPGMATAFCSAIGAAPSRIAVIGDTSADMHMARSAGAGLAIAVLSGGSSAGVLAPLADVVVADVTAAVEFLSRPEGAV